MPEKDVTADGPIRRAVKLLRLLTEVDGDLSVKSVASRLDLPVSTAHRLLHILMREGMVEQVPVTAQYRVGLDLIRIGSLLASKQGIPDLARPYLQRVVDQCDEACMFVAYLPASRQVSVMEAVNSSQRLRYDIELYTPHSLCWGATGRSILAFLPEDEQIAAITRGEPSPASLRPLPPWPELKRTLAEIRARGYARTEGEKIKGALGLGVPVRKAGGAVVGSLCITVPQMRFDPAAEPRLVKLLTAQASAFSATLGWHDHAGIPDASE